MTAVWISVLTLNILIPVCAVNISRPWFLSVKSGDPVTLNCPFGAIQTSVFWYKQIPGEIPQLVGKRLAYNDVIIVSEFQTSGFTMQLTNENSSLIIPHIKKDDVGFYYCGKSFMDDFNLASGTYVAVADDGGVKVSVTQHGDWDSIVPAGASVTLQCLVLFESRAAELQVLWFRAASPQSHPQIIYTHHNSSQQCESYVSTHTCVYNFSKNILSNIDTGTYYCAVALCGKIVFGNGTRIQLEGTQRSFKDLVLICLAVALGVCLIVIFAQILAGIWRMCENFSVRTEDPFVKKGVKQGQDAVELSFAALHLNKRRRKPDRADDYMYTEVIYSSVPLI